MLPVRRFGLACSNLALPCENQHQMKLEINGEEKSFEWPLTLLSLIEQMGLKPDRVAVELNREIVSRDRWAQTNLADGDRLEIVHFVGGGRNSCSASSAANLDFPPGTPLVTSEIH